MIRCPGLFLMFVIAWRICCRKELLLLFAFGFQRLRVGALYIPGNNGLQKRYIAPNVTKFDPVTVARIFPIRTHAKLLDMLKSSANLRST